MSIMTSNHRSFKAVAKAVSRKEGIPLKNANAIIASSARKASASAVRKNPRLLRVKR